MKADQVAALVRAHNDADGERFRVITLQIAANLDATSPRWSKTFKNLAEKSTGIPVVQQMTPIGGREAGLLEQSRATTTLDDMVISRELAEDVRRVLAEYEAQVKLAEYELRPVRKLLFVGPPGVGKSMMAVALANRLGLPLFRVQLHAVVSSFLGETAKKIGQIFDSIRLFKGVYFFDEFDALASARHGADDVGEMRRVVNALLVLIEQDESDSLIIGATNLVDVIDRAMFRRFDHVLAFKPPDADERLHLVQTRLIFPLANDLVLQRVVAEANGASHADLVWACVQINKAMVLAGERDGACSNSGDLILAINRRRPPATTTGELVAPWDAVLGSRR